MLDPILIFLTLAMGGGAMDTAQGSAPQTRPDGAPIAAPATASDAAAPLQAEPQTPTGKFTTATEIRPILTATKSSWVALREYEGDDLLYLTHLLSWRCGLLVIRVGVNGGAMTDWPMEPCHLDTATPNAIKAETGVIYRSFALGSVQSVEVEIVYDDLGRDSAAFQRSFVLMP